MITLDELRRIAEVEYAKVVISTAIIGVKLRIVLADTSYIDVWLSKKLPDRFGFHWERRAIDGTIFRYDNFPNTNWKALSSYPSILLHFLRMLFWCHCEPAEGRRGNLTDRSGYSS